MRSVVYEQAVGLFIELFDLVLSIQRFKCTVRYINTSCGLECDRLRQQAGMGRLARQACGSKLVSEILAHMFLGDCPLIGPQT